MRLEYPNKTARAGIDQRFIVLLRQHQRVELFIKATCGEFFSLIGLSGKKATAAQQSIRQGPYNSLAQGQAAMFAIANELKRQGFAAQPEHCLPRWELNAQAHAKQIKRHKAKNAGDFRFSPSDVQPGLF